MSSPTPLEPPPESPGHYRDQDQANTHPPRALFRLHGRLARTRNNHLWELELTSAQLRVLETLSENPGSGISEVARHLDLSRQAVHRLVHVLAGKGYLTLPHREPGDRRRLAPGLDPHAALCTQSAIRVQRELWREFTDELTGAIPPTDLQLTAMTLDRIWRHLSRRPAYGPGCEAP